MNLYLITCSSFGNRYDEYIGAVVVAETAEQARSIHPSGDQKRWDTDRGDWVTDPAHVNAQLIGVTQFKKPRVLLDSYNRG
jgi:hypothetical protein